MALYSLKKNKVQMSFLLFGFSIMMALFYSFVLLDSKMYLLEYELFLLNSVPFCFTMIFDKVSLSFSMIVTLISGCVFMFSVEYMEEDEYYWRFIWILLSFVVSMNFLIFAGSFFFMLLGWDGLGITSFALIVYYQSKDSLSAGFQTLLINRLGDVILVCSSFFYVIMGHFQLFSLFSGMSLFVLLMCLTGLTKSAQFPFSSWLPAAMAAPTPVSALVHSSTLVTAGIYLIIRFSSGLPLMEDSKSILLFCGSITCFLGGTAAVFENDLKKIIALSTLSQLGVMVFCLGLGLPYLSLFHLYAHALFKALLFLAAGKILLASFGNQDIRLLGGLGLSMPLCIIMFNISSMCLIGAPFMSAFFSKHLILEMMLMSKINLLSIFLMILATCSTVVYVIRSLKSICWFSPSYLIVSYSNSLNVYIPMIVLSVCSIFFGKMYSLLELSLTETVFLTKISSIFINMLMIVGIWIGAMISGPKNSNMFSLLFYLTPFYNFSTKVLSPFSKNMVMLDYGWLETGLSINNFINKFNMHFGKFNWPSYLSYYRISWILMLLLVIDFFI
nr:NADH dehydrogenase subunit 5 [Lymnaea stagnalis]